VVGPVTVIGEAGPVTVFSLNLFPETLVETVEVYEYVTVEPLLIHRLKGNSV
jgi:hypothetical protein